MEIKSSAGTRDQKQLIQVVLNLLYRFISVFVRFLMKHLFFGDNGLTMPSIKNLILLESAGNLALKIRTQKLTSVEVVSAFIERIKEVNPQLNCVVDDRFSEALKEATDADRLIASGTLSQDQLLKDLPFLGVPISTKDCISVKNMLNTAGVWARRNIRAEKDSPAMSKMRKAGAIPFGESKYYN